MSGNDTGEQPTLRSYAWRADLSLVCFLFVFSLFVCLLLLSSTRFDGLYGQDPYAYYDFAGELRAAVSQGHTLGPFFWPLGYPTLLAVVFTLFGTQATIGQATNVILGAGLSPLVYILARQFGLQRTGSFTTGLLMAVCGQALQSSLVLMSDIPALFWATASAAVLWKYLKSLDMKEGLMPSPARRWLITSAMSLALAIITRWIYLILVVPWGLAVVISWAEMPTDKGIISSAGNGLIKHRRELFVALAGAAVVLLPQILYSRTNPYPTLDHAWVEGWALNNYFQREFTNIDGHFLYDKINVVYYAQPFYDPYYLAPIFAPFLLIGLWHLFKAGYAKLLMVGGWVLLPYLFLAGIPYQNIRFPLIIFPAVALLAGAGMETAIGWARRISPRRAVDWLAWAAAGILVIYGVSQMVNAGRGLVNTFINNQQRDKDTAAWAAQQIPAGETLYTFGLTLTLKHYTSLNVYEIYYETPETLASKWMPGHEDYLLVNVWNIENQWVGRGPQLDFHWLRDQHGLTEIGTYGYFTLYKIHG